MSPERILESLLSLVLLANAVQVFLSHHTKRLAHAIKEDSERIHVLVNSRLTLALAQNEALKSQIEGLIRRIAELTEEES